MHGVRIIIITGIVLLLSITYVVGDCGLPPIIENSRNNLSDIYHYSEKSVIGYSCFLGYRPAGDPIYTCSDGEWTGGPFSCHVKECLPLGSPNNGRKIGNGSEIGYVARFECNTGFELIGSATSQCRLDLKWQPSTVPECRRKKCQAELLIEHGNVIVEHSVNGQSDVYGAVLRVQCNDSFIRSGPARIYCTENGQWTEKPKCKPVKCPTYPGLDSKCLEKTKVDEQNILLLIFCTANSTFIHHGDRAVRCENNTWDDLSLRCFCDCKVNADTDRVHFHNLNSSGLVKHNETLFWSCENMEIKNNSEPLMCNNGMIKTPICPNENNVAETNMNPTIYGLLGIVVVTLTVIGVCYKFIRPRYNAKSSGTNKPVHIEPELMIYESSAAMQNGSQELSQGNSCNPEMERVDQEDEDGWIDVHIRNEDSGLLEQNHENTYLITSQGVKVPLEEVHVTSQMLSSLPQLSTDDCPESANKVNSQRSTSQTDLSEKQKEVSTSSCLLM